MIVLLNWIRITAPCVSFLNSLITDIPVECSMHHNCRAVGLAED
jgi:hypothetical protein